jgi:hypothetical protein
MAEARLRKNLADPTGFNDKERKVLQRASTQLDRWTLSVELAFRRHYSVPIHRDLDEFQLGLPAFLKYRSVISLLDAHLASVIEDRNNTAHGQWAWHLNSKETAFVGPASEPLNYAAIKARSDLIEAVGDLVHILVVSEPTFERDFDVVAASIDRLSTRVEGAGYEDFARTLRSQEIESFRRLTGG